MLTEKKSKKNPKNKKKPLEFLFIMNINKTSKESQYIVKNFHQQCCPGIIQTSGTSYSVHFSHPLNFRKLTGMF